MPVTSGRVRTVRAVMARWILVNYRVAPEVLARWVPKPFRMKTVGGWGVAGVCLMRLEALRPEFVPTWLGLASENAAHRIAIEWDTDQGPREGVFVLRRDSDSVVSRWLGGRLFPGLHGAATFRTRERGERTEVEVVSRDGCGTMRVEVTPAERWPTTSVFTSLEDASGFFRRAGCGWSPTRDGRAFEGSELEPEAWEMEPMTVLGLASRFFSEERRFPVGSVELDSACRMRGIPHRWRDLGRMAVDGTGPSGRPVRVRSSHGASALFHLP